VKTLENRFALLRAPLHARLAAAFVLSSLLPASTGRASERWATLEAIHQLENPRNSPQPGMLGELGPYQFREQTWRMYTQAPFSKALDRQSSDAVAVRHYDWLRSELERRGVEPSAFRIALAWNGGIGAALDKHPGAAVVDYATRAANLAAEFERNEPEVSR
jgi:hypothetical protein